jgi:hypothetical protein
MKTKTSGRRDQGPLNRGSAVEKSLESQRSAVAASQCEDTADELAG